MNSIITNISRGLRIAFGSKSAISEVANETIQQDKLEDRIQHNKEQVIRSKQYKDVAPQEPVVGHVSTEDLTSFSSDYGRTAVAQLGSWSAIARGFTEFCKNPKSETVDGLCHEFHAWNAVCVDGKQMDEEQTLLTIAKLSTVKPAVGNKQTDEVIARVLKKSIQEVQQDRINKALVKSKQREDHILGFNSLLWASVWSDGEFSMPAQKVVDKLEQTLLWMAGWDTTNPASLATELLLLESDMNMVKAISKKSPTNDFESGTMTSDALTRRMA